MTTRADIHSLVDRLSDEQLEAAGRSLEAIRAGADDPLVKLLLSAPYDDEPCGDDEHKSADEAWARYPNNSITGCTPSSTTRTCRPSGPGNRVSKSIPRA